MPLLLQLFRFHLFLWTNIKYAIMVLWRSVISIFTSELLDFNFLWYYNFKEVEYPAACSQWWEERGREEILLIFDLIDAKSVPESDICWMTCVLPLKSDWMYLSLGSKKFRDASICGSVEGEFLDFCLLAFTNGIRIMRTFPSSELHKTLAEMMFFFPETFESMSVFCLLTTARMG